MVERMLVTLLFDTVPVMRWNGERMGEPASRTSEKQQRRAGGITFSFPEEYTIL